MLSRGKWSIGQHSNLPGSPFICQDLFLTPLRYGTNGKPTFAPGAMEGFTSCPGSPGPPGRPATPLAGRRELGHYFHPAPARPLLLFGLSGGNTPRIRHTRGAKRLGSQEGIFKKLTLDRNQKNQRVTILSQFKYRVEYLWAPVLLKRKPIHPLPLFLKFLKLIVDKFSVKV